MKGDEIPMLNEVSGTVEVFLPKLFAFVKKYGETYNVGWSAVYDTIYVTKLRLAVIQVKNISPKLLKLNCWDYSVCSHTKL